ncbi:MAG: hypothetical protein IJC88_03385 [Oscillospiraceae bacterium]|nr:hypothetical protein [Oscillospiraceae bacterium]
MKTRESLKNLLLVVLLLGMTYLAVMTWAANNPKGDYFGLFSSEDEELVSELEFPDVDVSPLSVSIRTANGRHSAIYDTAAVEFAYGQTGTILRRAVQSASNGKLVDEQAWLSAIGSTASVLYDYQCDVPMSVFSFWYGNESPDAFSEYRVRYLCLSVAENMVYLHGKSADGTSCFSFVTDVPQEDLSAAVSVFQPNSYQIGIESNRTGTPELLISEEIPQVPELRVVNVAQVFDANGLDHLLQAFDLNPNTVSRHIEQDGSRMFVEDTSTVKITSAGVVTYSDLRTDLEYNTGLKVRSAAEVATLWEKAEAARELVVSIDALTDSLGNLYLENIVETADAVEILFGREIGGVPVDFQRDRAIARVRIQGNRISEVEFVLRRYSASATNSILLSSKLAAAAETSEEGKELFLRYLDVAQETVRAAWYLK